MLNPIQDCSNYCDDNTLYNKCLDNILRARYNALIMLKNRGYYVSESILNIDKERLSILYKEYLKVPKSNILNCVIKNKDCYAKIVWIQKLPQCSKAITEFKEEIIKYRINKDNFVSVDDNLVIILTQNTTLEPLDYFLKNQQTGFYSNIENDNISLFSLSQLQTNILEHRLVPPHIKLTNHELQNLKKKYKIEINQLPKIIRFASITDNNTGDPIARLLGGKTGDVYKIKRNNPNGLGVSYRVIVDESNSNLETKLEITESEPESESDLQLPLEYLGKTKYQNASINSSYSGRNYTELKNKLKSSILYNEGRYLSELCFEFTSFYYLYYSLNLIHKNYIEHKNIKKHLGFLKSRIPNLSLSDIDSSILLTTKSISTNIFGNLFQYLCNLCCLYYLDQVLINELNSCLQQLNNIIKSKSSPDEFFQQLYYLVSLFKAEELKSTLTIEKIYTVFLIPKNIRDLSKINDYQNQQLQLLKDLGKQDFIKWKTIKTLDITSYKRQLTESSYDLTILNNIRETYRNLLILFYFYLVFPKFYDGKPGLSFAFVIFVELLKLIGDGNSNLLETQVIIDSIFDIMRKILENKSPLLETINVNYNFYFKNKSNLVFVVNSILLVTYRDSSFINTWNYSCDTKISLDIILERLKSADFNQLVERDELDIDRNDELKIRKDSWISKL